MAQIRVVRVLEYVYENSDVMLQDIARWKIPPQGVEMFVTNTIRSCYMIPEMEIAAMSKVADDA